MIRPRRHRVLLATRLTAAFVLVAALTGGLAGLVFARSLQLGLDDGLDLGLRTRAQTLTSQLASGSPGQVDEQLSAVRDTAGLTQVLTAAGEVLAASRAAGQQPLLDAAARERAVRGTYIIDADPVLPGSAGSRQEHVEVRLLGAPLTGGKLVVVGSPHDTVDDAVHVTIAHLFVAGLVGLVLAGLGARLLVGAALRPVEVARRQVEHASRDESAPGLVDPGGEDEFSRLVRTFNRLLSRQHELLQAERAFTADAGHELRTPLAILSGELELAARPARTRTEVDAALVIAKEETDRLIRLTEQLLLLAKGDERTLISRASGDVAAVLSSAVTALRPLAAEAGVEVTVSSPAQVVASIDIDRLRLAVDNILRNAIRFAPRASIVEARLELAAAEDGGALCRLRVADAGPGFAESFLPHAFDRFRRDDEARGRAGDESYGAGLGLAIVSSVVRAHGGAVHAANRNPGPGAVVGFDLPIAGAADV